MTFKFWKLLKNASEVTLVPKKFFFLKILNLVRSIVECKVSLADGIFQFAEQVRDDSKMLLQFSAFFSRSIVATITVYALLLSSASPCTKSGLDPYLLKSLQ